MLWGFGMGTAGARVRGAKAYGLPSYGMQQCTRTIGFF